VAGIGMNLQQYDQAKFAMAELLRSAATLSSPDDREWHDRLHGLFVRLAEDRFNLVVVGRFNRGKTSIMNAIMRTDRLPVGIVPLTSVITAVSYGSKEQVVLKYAKSSFTQDIPIETLSEYVTQKGNPGNSRGITIAEIQLRAEILRRGFYFIDTPGLGSAIAENTRTTEAFLPEADAFLLVTSYDSPLSEEEIRFLRQSSGRNVFVVLNKQDAVTPDERDAAFSFVRDQLQTALGTRDPQLFSASARDALNANRRDDLELFQKSGILAIEEALVSFLLAQRQNQFLEQTWGRVLDLVARLPRSSDAQKLHDRMETLAEQIPWHVSVTDDNNVRALPVVDVRAPTLRHLAPCEICVRLDEAIWRFECEYQHKLVVDHGEQRRFAEAGGFCGFHTWQYHGVASPYGVCAAYPALMDFFANQLRKISERAFGGAAHGAEQLAGPVAEDCVLCRVRVEVETGAISDLERRLTRNASEALAALSAICIPHFAKLAGVITDRELLRKLIHHQVKLLDRLSEDMKRFTLKHDATRRFLENKEETTAGHRTLSHVVGHSNVNASNPLMATRLLESAMSRLSKPGVQN
jgi:GTP-binding protein EngB required for normal cell division/CBS domain-containing protein